MGADLYLGEFELLVLLAVLRLADEAHGMRVRAELRQRARRDVSVGAVYATLDRLEAKGLLRSTRTEGAAAREGRTRRVFEVTAAGRRAVARVQATVARMADGLRLGEA